MWGWNLLHPAIEQTEVLGFFQNGYLYHLVFKVLPTWDPWLCNSANSATSAPVRPHPLQRQRDWLLPQWPCDSGWPLTSKSHQIYKVVMAKPTEWTIPETKPIFQRQFTSSNHPIRMIYPRRKPSWGWYQIFDQISSLDAVKQIGGLMVWGLIYVVDDCWSMIEPARNDLKTCRIPFVIILSWGGNSHFATS